MQSQCGMRGQGEPSLVWGCQTSSTSSRDRQRAVNPHIHLQPCAFHSCVTSQVSSLPKSQGGDSSRSSLSRDRDIHHPGCHLQPSVTHSCCHGDWEPLKRNKLVFMTQLIACLPSARSLNLACLVNLMGCHE